MATQAHLEFEAAVGWEMLPQGYVHKDVADVATDIHDNVYMLTRYDARVIVYDRSGNFLRSWGEGVLSERPHNISVGPDGQIYVVDEDDQTVVKFTPEGERLAVFGVSGVASDTGYEPDSGSFKARVASITRSAGPFNQPTSVVVAPGGDLFVADGYGNARIHHFRGDGTLVKSWGVPGTGPGEFYVPHGITMDKQGRLLVADRENDRIQFFSPDGEYLGEWTDIQRPSTVVVTDEGLVFVPEIARPRGDWSWARGRKIDSPLPARVAILDGDTGEVITRIGLGSGEAPCAPGNFASPHGIAVDSRGDLYVSEVTYSQYMIRGPANKAKLGPYPGEDCHTFQKIVRCDMHDGPNDSRVVRVEKPSV